MKKIFLTLALLSTLTFARELSPQEASQFGELVFSLGVKVVGGILLLGLISSSLFIVRQKTAAVVELFGKFSSVRTAGFNVKLPWPFATVVSTMNLQIRELKSTIGSRTKDESFLKLPIATQFRIIESSESIRDAYYELDDAQEQMRSYINNIARGRINELTVQQLYSAKGELEDTIKESLTKEFKDFGFEIVNVLVDDPILSDELIDASNRVLAAEKEKDAAKNEAEALKVKLVGEAEAEKESLRLKAEAFTHYRKETSEGNKESMDLMMGKVIIKEGVIVPNENYSAPAFDEKDILDFFISIDTNEAIRSASKSGATVVVSTPQSNTGSDSIAMIEALKNK